MKRLIIELKREVTQAAYLVFDCPDEISAEDYVDEIVEHVEENLQDKLDWAVEGPGERSETPYLSWEGEIGEFHGDRQPDLGEAVIKEIVGDDWDEEEDSGFDAADDPGPYDEEW